MNGSTLSSPAVFATISSTPTVPSTQQTISLDSSNPFGTPTTPFPGGSNPFDTPIAVVAVRQFSQPTTLGIIPALPESEVIRLQSDRERKFRLDNARMKDRVTATTPNAAERLALRLLDTMSEYDPVGLVGLVHVAAFLDKHKITEDSEESLQRLSKLLIEEARVLRHAINIIELSIGDLISGCESPYDLQQVRLTH